MIPPRMRSRFDVTEIPGVFTLDLTVSDEEERYGKLDPPGHEPGTACSAACGWCGACS